MPKRILHSDNTISVEFAPEELGNLFDVSTEQLRAWNEIIPVQVHEDGEEFYRFDASEEMRIIRHRVAILRTGMTVEQVKAIETQGPKMLAGYAAFAQDAPPGITALVWRTYAVVVYEQVRYGNTLNAEELAVRAGGHLDAVDPLSGEVRPSAELAELHLRLLQAVGALQYTKDGWEHSGLPACMRSS